jgi:hypothetical protein
MPTIPDVLPVKLAPPFYEKKGYLVKECFCPDCVSTNLLGIPVKLPTLIDAKNQVNIRTRPVRLVKNALVVPLSRP